MKAIRNQVNVQKGSEGEVVTSKVKGVCNSGKCGKRGNILGWGTEKGKMK